MQSLTIIICSNCCPLLHKFHKKRITLHNSHLTGETIETSKFTWLQLNLLNKKWRVGSGSDSDRVYVKEEAQSPTTQASRLHGLYTVRSEVEKKNILRILFNYLLYYVVLPHLPILLCLMYFFIILVYLFTSKFIFLVMGTTTVSIINF